MIIKVLAVVVLATASSCSTVYVFKSKPGNSAHAPGQIKKMTGGQSAKPYASGQQKKKN